MVWKHYYSIGFPMLCVDSIGFVTSTHTSWKNSYAPSMRSWMLMLVTNGQLWLVLPKPKESKHMHLVLFLFNLDISAKWIITSMFYILCFAHAALYYLYIFSIPIFFKSYLRKEPLEFGTRRYIEGGALLTLTPLHALVITVFGFLWLNFSPCHNGYLDTN
jgi:hypothetical protein